MRTVPDPNRENLERVALALGDLREELTFVGGAVVGLLVTDPAAPPIRVTTDVDCIVEVATRSDYFGRIRDHLVSLGFAELQGDGIPICAWALEGIRLDVMPTDDSILGFSSRWYSEAAGSAVRYDLGRIVIRLINAPYFLATKIDAFQSRGQNDFHASHDLEDLIMVIDGRPTVMEEIGATEPRVRAHIADWAAGMLADDSFLNALPGHVLDRGRERIVMERLRTIAQLNNRQRP